MNNPNFVFNLVFSTFILAVFALIIYYVYKSDPEDEDKETDGEYSIERLSKEIKDTFNNIINTNIAELGLNADESKKRERQKLRLNKALRNCSYGDKGEKEYVKDHIKDLLQKQFNINEATIDRVIPFENDERLSIQDKFEILLLLYKKNNGGNALENMILENGVNIEKEYEDGIYYEINRQDMEQIYRKQKQRLIYVDKLEIIAQRIYQISRGLGVVDELRDQDCLDGVSGGVSGITNNDYNYMEEVLLEGEGYGYHRYDSVWIFLRGKSIHLSFLSFGSKRELERVCKNIYRYDAPYFLSGVKGKVVAEDKRGNRITVARPPFSDDWKFFVRKFDSVKHLSIENLIQGENSEVVIETLRYIMAGNMVVVISGNQAVGKTTILKALVKFIDSRLNIRVEEDVFETWLTKIYKRRNISSFRKTDTISMEEGMDFTKKTDGDVLILGEVAEQKVASLLIQLSQFTKQTVCTNHSATVPKLINYFRNSMLSAGIFSDEKLAEEQVVNAIQWDIHMRRNKDGFRYIERITEIVPLEEEIVPDDIDFQTTAMMYFKKMLRSKTYKTRDIIVYKDGRYEVNDTISESSINNIKDNIADSEIPSFENFYQQKYLDKLVAE